MRINNRSNCCLKWLFCLTYTLFSLYVFMLTEVFQVQRFSRTWEYILHRLASYKMDMNMNINIQIQIHDGYITLLVYVRRLVVKKLKPTYTVLNPTSAKLVEELSCSYKISGCTDCRRIYRLKKYGICRKPYLAWNCVDTENT